jgi:N-acetyl-alpha-D-muramate 1-phosphate uridylyltransferase
MTHAMILAAGRGERMRPLTDATPKPLLQVQGKPLMQWHLEALARSGVGQVVINTAWLGEQVETTFGNQFGKIIARLPPYLLNSSLLNTEHIEISYSREGRDFGGPLETAGGIARALPQLREVFWLLAGDVFVPGFEFAQAAVDQFTQGNMLAHLWLVPNPPQHPKGDFVISQDGLIQMPTPSAQQTTFTYSTIGLYRRELFEPPWCDIPPGNPTGIKAPLVNLLRAAMAQGRVSGEVYTGPWTDVGTPERLAALNLPLAK